MKKITILVIVMGCILGQIQSFAQIKIASNIFINKNIPSISISEAGMDFQNELVFATDEIVISVTIFPQNLNNVIYNAWQIDISKNDLDWHKDLELYVRRTGDGKSDYNNKAQNGEYYQKLETNNVLFFEGQGWINSIPIQLKLSGLSVTLPAKSYTTEIIFTLIDN